MKEVYFFTDIAKLSEACSLCNIEDFSEKEVLVKLHMGEVKNKYFLRPAFVKKIIDELHQRNASPFLYDTTVCYRGPRSSVRGYRSVARLHGFSERAMGCKTVIDNTGVPVNVENITFNVGSHLYHATHVFAISHVKGHTGTGMGGAIKNFGMGGVTKQTKKWIHTQAKPRYIQENCILCGLCAENCPFHAITVTQDRWIHNIDKCFGCDACVSSCQENALEHTGNSLQYLIACAAKASVEGKRVIYLNELKRISKSCDCDPSAGPVICPDIGYLVSTDPVAIDAASLDLIYEKKPDVFRKENHIDPYDQIRYGEEIGFGTSAYHLVEL